MKPTKNVFRTEKITVLLIICFYTAQYVIASRFDGTIMEYSERCLSGGPLRINYYRLFSLHVIYTTRLQLRDIQRNARI